MSLFPKKKKKRVEYPFNELERNHGTALLASAWPEISIYSSVTESSDLLDVC